MMAQHETMLEQGQMIAQGAGGLYESPTSMRGEYDFEDAAEQEEDEQFIQNLFQQLTTLQGKLISDRRETAHAGDHEREKEIEEIQQLEQDAELLEQETGNLDKLVQSEDEKNIGLTEQLANRQLSNFQLSRKMEKLENELLEISELKQQSAKIGLHNKAMKERKLNLLRQHHIVSLKFQDQSNFLKTLNKQHQGIEAQTLMFQKRFCKLRNEQDKVIAVNQAYQHSLCILQTQIRQQTEINEDLVKKQQQLQMQLEYVLGQQQEQSKGNQHQITKEEIKQRKCQLKEELTLLQEIGDQFNDTFFSPLGSLRQLSTKALSTINSQAISVINNKPLTTRRHGIAINTQFSSAKKTHNAQFDQLSGEKQLIQEPKPPRKQFKNPFKESSKVVQVSDFDSKACQKESKFFISKKNQKYVPTINFNTKNSPEAKTKSAPTFISALEIQDICKNLINRLTFFSLRPQTTSQLQFAK